MYECLDVQQDIAEDEAMVKKKGSGIVCQRIPGPNIENHHCTRTVPIIFIPFLFYMLHVALLYNFLKGNLPI